MNHITPADLWNAILEAHALLQREQAQRLQELEDDFREEQRADARDVRIAAERGQEDL